MEHEVEVVAACACHHHHRLDQEPNDDRSGEERTGEERCHGVDCIFIATDNSQHRRHEDSFLGVLFGSETFLAVAALVTEGHFLAKQYGDGISYAASLNTLIQVWQV